MGFIDFVEKGALNASFSNIDSNKDGYISREELGSETVTVTKTVNGVKQSTSLNQSTFESFDTDGNNSIDKHEFYKGFGVNEESKGLSTGAIIGIVVGCIAVIGLVIGLIIYFSSRNAKKRKEEEQQFYEMQQRNNNNGNSGISMTSGANTQQIN